MRAHAGSLRPVAPALALLLLAPLLHGVSAAEANPVRAILSLEPGAPPPDGVRILHRYAAFAGVLVEAEPAALRALAAPGLLGVYPVEPLAPHLDLAGAALGLSGPQAPAETGRGVAVAVVDTGIDPHHPAYRDRLQAFAVDASGVTPSAAAQGSDGHGTRVVGILAGDGAGSPDARYRGMAPGARVVGLDLGGSLDVDTALRAFDWILANHDTHGIRVVVNAWGREGAVDGRFDPAAPLVRASDALVAEGLLVVFSAGNRGGVSSMSSEALNPNVLAVGAADAGGRLADFSSQGPGLDAAGRPLAWTKPDLVAVGRDVVGPGPASVLTGDRSLAVPLYSASSGTSLAAPMVAGAAALLLEARPALAPGELARALTVTARDLGPHGADPASGAGLLDVPVALALVRDGAVEGTVARSAQVAFPARVVAAAGSGTLLDSPSAPAAEFVGWLPVLPGSAQLRAEVRASGPLAGSFTARLLDPDGGAGPVLTGSSTLTAQVPAPAAGVWQLRVRPTSTLHVAELTLWGESDAVRHGMSLVLGESLAPAGDPAGGSTPPWMLGVALGAALVAAAAGGGYALTRRR